MSYALPIPRDQFYECPGCGRSAWHQCTIYLDHETRKCKTCAHEWTVKFTAYGADFDLQVRKETRRLADLVNDLIGETRSGRLTPKKQERLISSLLYLRSQLVNFLQEVPDDAGQDEEPEDARTISNRSLDYPYMFRREYGGRLFEGVVFTASQEEAVQLAKHIRQEFGITAISKVVLPTQEYPQRYLVMLPRDPRNTMETVMVEHAKGFLLEQQCCL